MYRFLVEHVLAIYRHLYSTLISGFLYTSLRFKVPILDTSFLLSHQYTTVKSFVFDRNRLIFIMSPQLGAFSIVGDSNIRRHMLSSACRSGRPLVSAAQFVPCSRLSALSAALETVNAEADACVVACITNFVTSTKPSSSLSLHIEPIFQSFFEKSVSLAQDRPTIQVFVCPPMYRTSPLWYRDGLPEILAKFSSCFRTISVPPNLRLMPGFSRYQLEADGVHLDPYSGIEYINHLFNTSQELINTESLSLASRVQANTESSRAIEDRVIVLEQGQARLSSSLDLHTAITAEFIEFQENVRNEVFIMVQGLPRLPKLDPKEWQLRARDQVDRLVLEPLGFEYRTVFIQNSTGKGKDSRTLYKACMPSVAASKEIRDKFSRFFTGGKDSRPPALSQISVRNCVTPGTLARVAIMQLFAKRYRDSNPGSRTQVVAFESRPVLKLFPPSEASDSRTMTMNFIEAVQKLPKCFTQEEIDGVIGRISPRLHHKMRSLFVVVSEDMLKKKPRQKRAVEVESDADSEIVEVTDGPSGQSDAPNRRKRPPSTPASAPSSKK